MKLEEPSMDNETPQDGDEPTFPCRTCGRRFIKSSLEKHEPACKKLSKLSRKPFDSGKQRATGSDITISDVRRAQKEKDKLGGQFPRPKTQWQERHQHFIDAVSSSKKVDYALKTGAPLPPPPKTSVPSDYVNCPHCGRNFNSQAAERHMPFCKEQQARKTPARPIATRGVTGQGRRDGSLTRQGRLDDRGTTSHIRRKSVETRSKTTRSATQHSSPPSTAAAKRSNSAPRNNNGSRLKTPAPPKTPGPPKTPAAPKTRDGSRGKTSRESRFASRF